MTSDDNKRQEYFRRVRRLKRILRPLPRRANVHRYPVLKWFASTARKRSYLWSFRKENIVPAIYIGSILALLPPPTPQMPLTLLLALLLHFNIMVGAALTFITNPFTIVPLYYADYKIGGFILDTFWHPSLMEEITPEIAEIYTGPTAVEPEVKLTIMQRVLDGWVQTAVGGLILGLIFGVVIHIAYLLLVRYYNRHSQQHPYGLLGRYKQRVEAVAAAVAAKADSLENKDASADAADEEETAADATAPKAGADNVAAGAGESPAQQQQQQGPATEQNTDPTAPEK